jgi:hypothetical protein
MPVQVLYRIYTQDRDDYRDQIIQSLERRGIPDFTLAPAIGYGPGQGGEEEETAIIEVAADDSHRSATRIRGVVDDIRRNNAQQAVLVMCIPVTYSLVTSEEENQLRLPIEGILQPQSQQEDKFVKKPSIVARSGKWEMLLKTVKADMGEVAELVSWSRRSPD